MFWRAPLHSFGEKIDRGKEPRWKDSVPGERTLSLARVQMKNDFWSCGGDYFDLRPRPHCPMRRATSRLRLLPLRMD